MSAAQPTEGVSTNWHPELAPVTLAKTSSIAWGQCQSYFSVALLLLRVQFEWGTQKYLSIRLEHCQKRLSRYLQLREHNESTSCRSLWPWNYGNWMKCCDLVNENGRQSEQKSMFVTELSGDGWWRPNDAWTLWLHWKGFCLYEQQTSLATSKDFWQSAGLSCKHMKFSFKR